jgi:cytochrome c553
VAALARTCGECHQTTNAGPSLPAEVQAPAVEGMLLHAFGTEQLWLGLTAANRATWMRGASIIAENEAGGAEMEALRALARRALEAAHPAERAEIYGNLIAECASCHAAHQ